MEDRGRAKVTVTGEAAGRMDRLPLSAGGRRGGASVSSPSAKYHPMALWAAVTLSHSTLSTGVSCQVAEDSRAPGLGAAVRAGGAARALRERGPGKAGLEPSASSSMDWQEWSKVRLRAVLLVKRQSGQVKVCWDTPLPPQSPTDARTNAPCARPAVAVERGAAQAPGLPSTVRRRTRAPSAGVTLLQGRVAMLPHTLGPMVARLCCTSVLSCTQVATR